MSSEKRGLILLVALVWASPALLQGSIALHVLLDHAGGSAHHTGHSEGAEHHHHDVLSELGQTGHHHKARSGETRSGETRSGETRSAGHVHHAVGTELPPAPAALAKARQMASMPCRAESPSTEVSALCCEPGRPPLQRRATEDCVLLL